jgi:hypothetical protein
MSLKKSFRGFMPARFETAAFLFRKSPPGSWGVFGNPRPVPYDPYTVEKEDLSI